MADSLQQNPPPGADQVNTAQTTTITTEQDQDPTTYLLTYLSQTRKLDILHASVLDSLSRTGWTQRVRALAFELIRSRRCTRFDDVVDHIVEMAAAGPPTPPAPPPGQPVGNVNGNGTGLLGKRKREAAAALANGKKGDGAAAAAAGQPEKKRAKNAATANSNTGNSARNGKADKKNSKAETYTNGDGAHHPPPSASSLLPTTTSSSSPTDIDVRIPPAAISQGAKFLRDTLNDLFIWGGDDEGNGFLLSNDEESDADADADADADDDADAGAGVIENGVDDSVEQDASTAGGSSSFSSDNTERKAKVKTKKGEGGEKG
jgi:hypothetical protein